MAEAGAPDSAAEITRRDRVSAYCSIPSQAFGAVAAWIECDAKPIFSRRMR